MSREAILDQSQSEQKPRSFPLIRWRYERTTFLLLLLLYPDLCQELIRFQEATLCPSMIVVGHIGAGHSLAFMDYKTRNGLVVENGTVVSHRSAVVVRNVITENDGKKDGMGAAILQSKPQVFEIIVFDNMNIQGKQGCRCSIMVGIIITL